MIGWDKNGTVEQNFFLQTDIQKRSKGKREDEKCRGSWDLAVTLCQILLMLDIILAYDVTTEMTGGTT